MSPVGRGSPQCGRLLLGQRVDPPVVQDDLAAVRPDDSVKLVVREEETAALEKWLVAQARPVVASELARTEVVRAVRVAGPQAVSRAKALLARLRTLPVDTPLLDSAADIGPPRLRTLDALHLCAEQVLERALDWFVTYDTRLLAAAEEAGLPIAAPGSGRAGLEKAGQPVSPMKAARQAMLCSNSSARCVITLSNWPKSSKLTMP
ncbi:type II toxin-antitoxin system VapC family toxin [Microbispora sp. RL4-1S]|uniref:Type II toxin-antitoxin system VapC family toxin n=1 Tax=Microbispora oryzae TaxID=2806554 RepID=A0A940WBY0_9ACTN|nr:type II toxin-antitoxin system VapC family toxin [Microbispora oryzae]MBP2702665.1 type II toxin-antitoxin system VapC family toxin [Microbispora oryzae]